MIGTKLAHYEITGHLGSGGMGDVYQATDSKLGRSVAIKFLPEAFNHDAERVARFEREARVLASLNHPNIAAIYGMEQSAAHNFLVMELVPGETLAQRIVRGAIPVEEALQMAMQMAEALEAAHEKGIIHRDLKPANVKVTPEGKVKVLDFGLAKALHNSHLTGVGWRISRMNRGVGRSMSDRFRDRADSGKSRQRVVFKTDGGRTAKNCSTLRRTENSWPSPSRCKARRYHWTSQLHYFRRRFGAASPLLVDNNTTSPATAAS